MAKLPGKFNAKDVDGRMGEYSAVPADKYRMRLKESARTPTNETKKLPAATQSRGVHYYKMAYEITEGKYKGRLIFSNLNLEHEKESVVEIAEKELASLCDACGKITVEDTTELHGIEFTGNVGVKAATAQFGESNFIRGYESLKGAKKPMLADEGEENTEKQDAPAKKRKVTFG